MNKITKSGFFYEESGQLMLVTQGLFGYTLVAHKKILFRLYMDLSATRCVTVLATVTYKILGFTIKKSVVIPTESLLIESPGLLGDSVGVLFTGDMFPLPSPFVCSVEFDVFGNPSSVPHFSVKEMVFLKPGRLRLMIHNLSGTAPWGTTIVPNFSWLIDMFQALERLSAMMPVRDGLKLGLTHTDAGLCYVFGENLDPWPAICPSGNAPPCTQAEMVEFDLQETNAINSSGTAERVDATVVWRPRDLFFPASGGESGVARRFPTTRLRARGSRASSAEISTAKNSPAPSSRRRSAISSAWSPRTPRTSRIRSTDCTPRILRSTIRSRSTSTCSRRISRQPTASWATS